MRRIAWCIAFLTCAAGVAIAQPQQPKPAPVPVTPAKPKPPRPPQEIVVRGLAIDGKVRGLGLLYFLERANEELERSTLERRSFIPHMTRSIEEEAL